jgi:hypothetical protein
LAFIWLLVFLRESIRKNCFYLVLALTPLAILNIFSTHFESGSSKALTFNRIKKELYIESSLDQFNHEVLFGRCTSSPEKNIQKWMSDRISLEYLKSAHGGIVVLYDWQDVNSKARLDCDVLVLAGPMPEADRAEQFLKIFSPELLILHPGYYRSKSQKWREYLIRTEASILIHEARDGWLSLAKLSRE